MPGFSVAGLGKGLEESVPVWYQNSSGWSRDQAPIYLSGKCTSHWFKRGTAVVRQIAALGYDCRWCVISAASLGDRTSAKDGSYWATPNTMDHLPPRQGEAMEANLYRGDASKASKRKRSGNLREQVAHPSMWPTPTVQDSKNTAGPAQLNRHSPSLNAAVTMFPTPDASPRGARINQNGHTVNLQDVIGSGKLNPQWVEWLMGYRTGYTDLEPWATDWFLSKRAKRSKS